IGGDARTPKQGLAEVLPSLPQRRPAPLHPLHHRVDPQPGLRLPQPAGDLLETGLAALVELGAQTLETTQERGGFPGRLRSILLHGFFPTSGVVDSGDMYRLVRGILFRLEPERAHALASAFLRWLGRIPSLAARLRRRFHRNDPRLEVRFAGLVFPSPVGVAAGFDKGEGLAAGLFALGFGFVEVGTITPRPQPGNPRPRLFRLPRKRALINRMGFNNAGAEATARRYARMRFRPGPLGFNLGKN